MGNPNIEAAYFWVQIGQNETNKKFKVKGSDFPNVAKGPEMVWVQRGDDYYWTWFGAPKDENNPDFTYRFTYFVEGFNEGLPGDQREQPDGDGLINLSLYFETPGPYPTNEWRNIRNQQQVVKDLDNKELILKHNPDLKEGDICRITHEGGDFEGWYVVDTPDGNNFLKFKTLYRKSEEDNRERTDLKRTGRKPNPDGTQVLRFDFYAAEKATPYNRIDDNDWVWAQAKDSNNQWQHYKVSGKNFKALFNQVQPNFEVTSGTVYFNMKMYDTSKTYKIEREDGWTRNVSGNYTNSSLGVGKYVIPMDDCEWFRVDNCHGYFDFKPNFNTSNVSCMWRTFFKAHNFNGAVNHFNMSNVKNTKQMFYCAKKFNQSISGWNLSSCEDASEMFIYAEGFNANVADLVFGQTNCYGMFSKATSFNQPLTNWNTTNIVNIAYMFSNCYEFNQAINHLDFRNAPNVHDTWGNCKKFNQDFTQVKWAPQSDFLRTFGYCFALNHPRLADQWPFPADTAKFRYAMYRCTGFRQSIANWTQPLPPIADGLFGSWTQFNQRVSHLDMSQVTQFEEVFSYCTSFNADDIGDLDVKGVKKMGRLFRNCRALNRDLSKWDVSECENFGSMFIGTETKHFNIGGWDVSNAKSLNSMFKNSIVGDDLSGWDVRNVTDFRSMFYNWGTNTSKLSSSNKLNVNIDNWDPRSATNITCMFKDAGNSSYIETINTNAWRMPQMKYNQNLSNIYQQVWMDWDKSSGWNYSPIISGVPGFGMPVIEPGYEPTYTIIVGRRNGTSSDHTYFVCSRVEKVILSDGKGEQKIEPYNDETQFSLSGYANIAQIDLFERSEEGHLRFAARDYRNAYQNKFWSFVEPYGPHPELMNAPTNMHGAFTPSNSRYCPTYISGLQFINTSKVENMNYMFAGINEWRGGENNAIGEWDVSNVNDMDRMFQNSTTPSFGDLSEWCVKNVPSKPQYWPDKNNDIVTKDPLWGLCPSDPDFELPPWYMPDGPWNGFFQSYFWTWPDYVGTNASGEIHAGSVDGWWYRTPRGQDNWESVSQGNRTRVDSYYDYIFATQESSNSPKWTYTHYEMVIKAADTANVTNMSCMFFNMRQFNSDISKWNVSNVTKINNMFNNCRTFNQDLSDWDFSNVTRSPNWDKNTYEWRSDYKPEIP